MVTQKNWQNPRIFKGESSLLGKTALNQNQFEVHITSQKS